ncbi:DUF58 domain-containing protein [Planctomycetes bacterium K23_9]|uniref:DUF58 domain-containing protein n=1 Tax=Stieleria marina TaxID=1930275 RepID=A0A517NZQ9_9BACT|nr:hypothetical protein K239x_46180 [Planctomycetes bacterium K23_9]
MSDTTSNEPSPSFAIFAGICALLLCGMLFGASLWILAAISAGGVLLVNKFVSATWAQSTVASRQNIPSEIKVGSLLDVKLQVTNTSRIPIFWILVEDLLPRWAVQFDPPTLAVEGDRIKVLLLWPGETKDLEYQIRCNRRGYFQIGPTVLETGDLMGFYRRYRVGSDPQYVTVLPEIRQLGAYEIGSRRPIGEIRMRDNVMDDPTRLRGIRRWQPGDPMRSVHWAATARTGTLHSKIYEPSSIAGATLVLDLHESTNPQHNEPFRSDVAITAAASIAAWLHESGEPFALASNGRDAADRIRTEGWVGDHRVRGEATAAVEMLSESDRRRPVLIESGRGPVHLKQMIRTLARLERTDALKLSELLVESESRLSAETTVLIILQQATPETIASIVSLSRRGRAVAVIINTHDINDYSSIAGPLIACNIPTHHLSTKESIADVCRKATLR